MDRLSQAAPTAAHVALRTVWRDCNTRSDSDADSPGSRRWPEYTVAGTIMAEPRFRPWTTFPPAPGAANREAYDR